MTSQYNREKRSRMKNICIFGVGGVGGYFGGKIAYANNRNKVDNKVYFIARGEHLDKIRKKGLILNTSESRGMVCRPALATDTLEEIPAIDLYLIAVKSYDLDNAVKQISQNIKDHTVLIPLLNGVDIYERIRHLLNSGIVLPACVYVGTHIEEPGMVTQAGGEGTILLGRDPRYPDYDLREIINIFKECGISNTLYEDVNPHIWEKYVFIAAYGLITAYSSKTLGEVAADKDLFKTVKDIMKEIETIARAKGVALSDDIVDKSAQKAFSFPMETKTSYQRDIEKKGTKNEGDLFGGTIVRMGRELGISTPKTDEVYSIIQKRLT
jgi:2-dehydropantoate 2-reductase